MQANIAQRSKHDERGNVLRRQEGNLANAISTHLWTVMCGCRNKCSIIVRQMGARYKHAYFYARLVIEKSDYLH